MNKEDFIKLLNQDLASEFTAIIQYTTYASQVTGPFRPELSKFMLAEVADEQLHAQFLADKIVTLGGIPTTTPNPVPPAKTVKAMLEEILKAEGFAVEGYTKRAEQAASLGYKALALDLEDMIRDETNHKEEVAKILSGWDTRL
jgi:bacterioferritin